MIHFLQIKIQFPSRSLLSIILLGTFSLTFALNSQFTASAQEEPLPSLSLIGVIVSQNTSSSVAVLKNRQTNRIKILHIGESFNDFILSQVFDNRIILKKGEKTYQIFLGRGSLVRATEPSPERPDILSVPEIEEEPAERQPAIDNLIKMEFNRAEVERRLQAELPLIMQEARFVPYIANGKVSGFRITNLPRSSILSEVGIRQNDILKKINDVELNNMESLFGLYERFKDDSSFEVSIERGGRLIRILYILN